MALRRLPGIYGLERGLGALDSSAIGFLGGRLLGGDVVERWSGSGVE